MIMNQDKKLDQAECFLLIKEIGRLIQDFKNCDNQAVEETILSEIKFLCRAISQS